MGAEPNQPPLRLGVLGCAEVARRRMLPAAHACPDVTLAALASRDIARAREWAEPYGCGVCGSYEALLRREDIDAVYIPLPNGLHAEWACRALESGKHVLVEKPLAVDEASVRRIASCARNHGLLVMENFLFLHHAQTRWTLDMLASGELGDIRLMRATFCFPPLPPTDVRYDPALGGGALLDAGTYTARAARLFLGEGLKVRGASLHIMPSSGVDTLGSALLESPGGQVAQLYFGFDAFYQCTCEFVGTRARLCVERAFSPPPGYRATAWLERQDRREMITLPEDDHWQVMLRYFAHETRHPERFDAHADDAIRQAALLDAIRAGAST